MLERTSGISYSPIVFCIFDAVCSAVMIDLPFDSHRENATLRFRRASPYLEQELVFIQGLVSVAVTIITSATNKNNGHLETAISTSESRHEHFLFLSLDLSSRCYSLSSG